ncbi:MAG: AraC family transcriptional regulator ligand-binding domain-containing protein [Myxococcales bacterium]|nr:AraC family transcriptional regulator ligand-binding domain-containing protein [Myxococcales bacterium]
MYARQRNYSVTEISAATGLPEKVWRSRFGWRPASAVPALHNLLATREPNVPHSLLLAAEVPLSAFGPLAIASFAAPNLRVAYGMLCRFRALFTNLLQTQLIAHGDTTHLQLRHPADVLDGGAAAEMGMLLLVRMIRSVVSLSGPVVALHFCHQPRGSEPEKTQQVLADAIGVPVHFGRDVNAIVLRTQALDVRLNTSGSVDMATAEQRLIAAVSVIDPSWRAETLREAASVSVARQEFLPSDLALSLRLGLRALQRRATAQGTTARGLMDAARRSRAEVLLLESESTVATIAAELGFSGPRAFRRFFLRTTGQTPSAYRTTGGERRA